MIVRPYLGADALWKQRFRVPRTGARIAVGAPGHGLVISNESGVHQLYAWDVSTGKLTQLTRRPEGTDRGWISPDGRYVYYLADQKGNEIGHYVRVPFRGGEPEDVTPALPPSTLRWPAMSRMGNLLGFTLADDEGFHLCCVDIGPGDAVDASRRLWQSKRYAWGPVLSADGGVAVMGSTERSGTRRFNLLALDSATGQQLGELWDGPDSSLDCIVFSPIAGDDRALAMTNRTGLNRPLIWDPRTGERFDLGLEDLEGDVAPLDWSPDGSRFLVCQMSRARQQLHTYHLQSKTLRHLHHPGGTLTGVHFAPAGEILATWQDASHPRQVITLDGETGRQTRTLLAPGGVPPSRPWQSITFASSDGQEIQGWLGLPDGEGPFPTVLKMHGGPAAVMVEAFNPESQTWMDHGFAFLDLNYRGSTTFGRKFESQIDEDPGRWELEDMIAARGWLVRQGIAHPDWILLTGLSYGGYLTLLALGRTPDLWAGGMARVAVADWAAMYEDINPSARGYTAAFFGGTPEQRPEQYAKSSPITYAGKVNAPVLVIQGRNDTRTPARQMELYEAKMRSLGKAIEIHWFEAGHRGPLAQIERSIEHMELMLRFAYRVLSGAEAQ